MGLVIAVKEAQFLLPVGGIIGGIHVQHDPPRWVLPVALHITLDQGDAHPPALPPPHPVLQSREGGLRSQVLLGRGFAHGQLQRRIETKERGVIGIFIPRLI